MKAVIIGGGNIGTALAVILSESCDTWVYTTKPDKWNTIIEYEDIRTLARKNSKRISVSSDIDEALFGAEFVFVTLPTFMRKEFIELIETKVKAGTNIIFVPGCGGMEFGSGRLMDKGCIVAGLDRVPCVSRLKEYGKSVSADWKKKVSLAAINPADTEKLCEKVSGLLKLQCKPLENYLTVTLIPSNQIMHTVRLSTMFKDYYVGKRYPGNILFYGEWDDETSKRILACDDELHQICSALEPIDLSGVIPLSVHYESETPEKLTEKIHSIESFKKVESPMIRMEDGTYDIDFSSRYFREDFPYGLCIIKALAIICRISTPEIDKTIKWYENISGKEYFTENNELGRDSLEMNIPQNYGIDSKEELLRIYKH